MTNAIDAAIAQAKATKTEAMAQQAAAAAAPSAPTNLPATAPVDGAVATAGPGPVTALSAAQMMQGSFSVDAFIKVSEDGIKIGDKPGLITDPLKVKIDLSEVFYYYGVKYGSNPTVYEKTTNRVTSLTGKPWGEVLQMAQRVEGQKFKGEYRSGDVPMTLLAPVKDIKGNEVESAGTRLGKSLSTTEWKEWEGFLRSAIKQQLNPDVDTVEVEVGFKARKNAAGQNWGVLTFKLLGAHNDEVAEAA